MATPIIDHNLLTLDYWQDSVTYEGKTVPGGTIGCEALNIPDTLREKLAQASIPLQKIVAAIKENNLTAELLRPAKGSVLHMIQHAKDTPPFSRADAAYYNGRVEHIFSEEGIQNTLAYVQAAAVVGLLATFNEQFRQGVGITKIITLAEELPATIRNYKSGMTAFADELHKGKRTPDGYAQVFGRIFSGQPKLSLDDKSWQGFFNTTIQYVSSVRSAQDAPQLMRRMHYMSFVSMFRSDLYEGLCVGHAPRKCAVCGNEGISNVALCLCKKCSSRASNQRIRKTAADIKPEELGVKYVTKRYQDYAKEMFPDSLKNTSEIKLVRQDMGYGIR